MDSMPSSLKAEFAKNLKHYHETGNRARLTKTLIKAIELLKFRRDCIDIKLIDLQDLLEHT
jgi:hypothetical protein